MPEWFTYLAVLVIGTFVLGWGREVRRFCKNALNPLIICSCGHAARRETLVGGSKGDLLYEVDLEDANRSLCPDCAARRSIACGLCGRKIFPGDFIITTELLTVGEGVLMLRRVPFSEGVACIHHLDHVMMTGVGVLTAHGEPRLSRHIDRRE